MKKSKPREVMFCSNSFSKQTHRLLWLEFCSRYLSTCASRNLYHR